MMAAASCSVRIIPSHRSSRPYLGCCSFPPTSAPCPSPSLAYFTPSLSLSVSLRLARYVLRGRRATTAEISDVKSKFRPWRNPSQRSSLCSSSGQVKFRPSFGSESIKAPIVFLVEEARRILDPRLPFGSEVPLPRRERRPGNEQV